MTNIQSFVEKVEHYSFSLSDIKEIAKKFGAHVNVVMYRNLINYSSLYELFMPNYDAVVLFYPTQSSNVGHWTCLLKHSTKPVIEFFDSYGFKPDGEIPYSKVLMEAKPVSPEDGKYYLTHLFDKIPKDNKVVNRAKLQSKDHEITTCGSHVLTRIKFRNRSLREYLQLFGDRGHRKNKVTPDEFVVMQIIPFLNNHHIDEIKKNESTKRDISEIEE